MSGWLHIYDGDDLTGYRVLEEHKTPAGITVLRKHGAVFATIEMADTYVTTCNAVTLAKEPPT